MEIKLEPDFYNKTATSDKDNSLHITDTSIKYLLYKFSITENYFFDASYESKNSPEVQLELLDRILSDLARSTETINALKKKIENQLIPEIDTENEK